MQNSVRNQAVCLLKNEAIRPNIAKLISRLICLPNSYQFQNMKCLKIDGKSCLNLLGKQVRRKLTLHEQTIMENCSLPQPPMFDLKSELIIVFFYKMALSF